MRVSFPEKSAPIFTKPARHKCMHGGRGGTKSWDVAQHFITEGAFSKHRYLCAREIQRSIKDSVHRLLVDTIIRLGLERNFRITDDSIKSSFGSEYIFKGLHSNISEVKSLEGIDRAWVEEAGKVSQDSIDILKPTIRVEGSEIYWTFNPEDENAAVHQMFLGKNGPPPDSIVIEINYYDNPWFPEVLRREMEYDKRVDYEKYEHVWLGKIKKYSQSLIISPQKIRIEAFDEPAFGTQFFYGADFGFSGDPTVLGKMFIKDNKLFIIEEAYGHGVEIPELHQFFSTVSGSHEWRITADSERPDTISFLSKSYRDTHGHEHKGYQIVGAKKGKGSVEDGIQFLRGFEEIVIHPRCEGAKDNFTNWKWKKDKITGAILPIPEEGSDHWPDLARYALEPYIKKNEGGVYTVSHDVY